MACAKPNSIAPSISFARLPVSEDQRGQRDESQATGLALPEQLVHLDGQKRAGEPGQRARDRHPGVAERCDTNAEAPRRLGVLPGRTQAQPEPGAVQDEHRGDRDARRPPAPWATCSGKPDPSPRGATRAGGCRWPRDRGSPGPTGSPGRRTAAPRNLASPMATRLMTTPDTMWSTRSVTVARAWTSENRSPAAAPTSSPTMGPCSIAPHAPMTVPTIIIPSSPMFTMPERSQNRPPSPARIDDREVGERDRDRRSEVEERHQASPPRGPAPAPSPGLAAGAGPGPARETSYATTTDRIRTPCRMMRISRGTSVRIWMPSSPARQHPDQDRGQRDAGGMVPAQEGDPDPGEPELRLVVDAEVAPRPAGACSPTIPASAPEIRNTLICAAPIETPPASADPPRTRPREPRSPSRVRYRKNHTSDARQSAIGNSQVRWTDVRDLLAEPERRGRARGSGPCRRTRRCAGR